MLEDKLKVLDLFSGILLAASRWAWNARADSRRSRSARLIRTAGVFLESTGRAFRYSKTCGS